MVMRNEQSIWFFQVNNNVIKAKSLKESAKQKQLFLTQQVLLKLQLVQHVWSFLHCGSRWSWARSLCSIPKIFCNSETPASLPHWEQRWCPSNICLVIIPIWPPHFLNLMSTMKSRIASKFVFFCQKILCNNCCKNYLVWKYQKINYFKKTFISLNHLVFVRTMQHSWLRGRAFSMDHDEATMSPKLNGKKKKKMHRHHRAANWQHNVLTLFMN